MTISIDIFIDVLTDIFVDILIDILIDISIDMLTDTFIDILTDKEEGGGRKEGVDFSLKSNNLTPTGGEQKKQKQSLGHLSALFCHYQTCG